MTLAIIFSATSVGEGGNMCFNLSIIDVMDSLSLSTQSYSNSLYSVMDSLSLSTQSYCNSLYSVMDSFSLSTQSYTQVIDH